MNWWRVRAAIALACALAWASGVAAQSGTTGAITGMVADASGAAVPNARITSVHVERNQEFEAVADAAGRFRFAYLPVGRHHVTIERDGFRTAQVDVVVEIGAALDLPVVLPLAGLSETVAVTAAIIEVGRTSVAERVTPAEVDSLPLNGRNYLNLALLAPGVSRTVTRNTDRFAETSAVPGTGISVAGQRNLDNTFLVDGLSANDDAAALAGTYFSQEVVHEFQVVTSGGAAEFGRASAGAVNIVTQSGTNAWRGRAYGYLRDERLDARNPFAQGRDPLSQVQFGTSIGGPLRSDRTFLFANIERTNEDRTGFVTISPGNTAAIAEILGAAGYPGPRPFTGPFPAGHDGTNVFARADHRASSAHLMAVRYSLYDISSANARSVGGLSDASRGTSLENRDQTVAVSSLVTWGGGKANDLRAQVTRSRLSAPANDRIGPSVTVAGVASFAASTTSPEVRDLDVVELADTLSLQHGSHLLKAGVDFLYNDLVIGFPGALPGNYTFSSLANLRSGTYVTFQQAFGEVNQPQSNMNAAAFLQDEWRAADALTLSGGVRYDLQDLADPIRTDWDNVSPRLGLAWAPGDRRTVVRASAGLYFDRIPLRAVSNALQRDGAKYKVAVLSFGQPGAPAFPQVLPRFPDGLVTAITTIDPAIEAGMSRQASVQVEREVAAQVSVTAAYLALRGSQIVMSRNVNAPTLSAAEAARLGVPNLGRPDAAFANISRYESIGRSQYDALTMSVRARAAALGRPARGVHALAHARRRRECVLQHATGERRCARRLGAVGQRSAAPRRVQRVARPGADRAVRARRGPRLVSQLGLRVHVGGAVQRADRRRSKQRHERERSASRRRAQQRTRVRLGHARPARRAAVSPAPPAGRGGRRGVQRAESHEPAVSKQYLRHRDRAPACLRPSDGGRRSPTNPARSTGTVLTPMHQVRAALFVVGLALAATVATQAPAPVHLTVAGRAGANAWVAADGARVAVAWSGRDGGGGTDVYAAVSADGGRTFAAPVLVNDRRGTARVNGEMAPRVTFERRAGQLPAIDVLWTARDADTTIRLARSTDGGKTFGASRELQRSKAAGNRGWAALTTDSRGAVHALWLDHRGTVSGSAVATPPHHGHDMAGTAGAATDGAAAAQKSGLYYSNGSSEQELVKGVCYCCKTALAAGPDGDAVCRVAPRLRREHPRHRVHDIT